MLSKNSPKKEEKMLTTSLPSMLRIQCQEEGIVGSLHNCLRNCEERRLSKAPKRKTAPILHQKKEKKNGDRTGVRRMQIKNANIRNALHTNFCFLWRNNRTKKQKGQTKKTTTTTTQGRLHARARSGAWLTWRLPRHGIANLASQSWFLLLGTRHVASRDGHVECCEVVFF